MKVMEAELKISPELRRRLLEKSDFYAIRALATTYLLIVAGAAIVLWPAPMQWLRWALAIVLFGSAQIGLAVLMHECAHRSLFRRRTVNDWVGCWLCAEVLIQDLHLYRRYHLLHHKFTGSDKDPDAHITQAYPVSRRSLLRKVSRDLFGITGIKTYAAIVAMKARYFRYQLNGKLERDEAYRDAGGLTYFINAVQGLRGSVLVYGLLCLLCFLTGAWSVLLLWLLALFSAFQLMLRLRQIGDHGMVADRKSENIFKNTRTTDALFAERVLLAPHQVHLHMEHHLLPGVPCYRLPLLREELRSQGLLDQQGVAHSRSYAGLLRAAIKS